MPTIYIDDDVFGELQKRAIPLVDNPNTVLRRMLALPDKNTRISLSSERKSLEIPLTSDYPLKYGLIPISKSNRSFFPGFKVPFQLETDIGTLSVKVTSGAGNTPTGDSSAGDYLTGGLKALYKKHPPVEVGDSLVLESLEPGKQYKLLIKRKPRV